MKRLFPCVLALVCLCAFASCGAGPKDHTNLDNPERDVILTAPPALTVCLGEDSIQAMRGTTSWNYDNEDGTWSGFESDSLHPLDMNSKDLTPTLVITPEANNSQNFLTAQLKFDIPPDEISVRCWSETCWGDTDAQSEDIPIEDFTIELKDGGYIYEVISTWSSSERYNGTARDSFYAGPASPDGSTIPAGS